MKIDNIPNGEGFFAGQGKEALSRCEQRAKTEAERIDRAAKDGAGQFAQSESLEPRREQAKRDKEALSRHDQKFGIFPIFKQGRHCLRLSRDGSSAGNILMIGL